MLHAILSFHDSTTLCIVFETFFDFESFLQRLEKLMRIWAKIITDNRILKDIVIENIDNDTRTHKVFNALDKICYTFDLSKPIWLDATVSDFKRHSKCRFREDSFIDSIDFDYLEIEVLEED